jgi:GT2 family glycosyltransferase
VSHYGAKIKPNYITEHVKDGHRKGPEGSGVIPSDYVTGALFACETDLFVRLCGFDPGYRPAYFEELDFCLKLKKIGKRAYVNPKSRARHFECGSVKKFSPSFYYYYHKNRIRCAIIHESPKDFFMRFLAAETAWFKRQASRDQYMPLCRAYLVNLFFLAGTVSVKIKNYFLLKRIV